MRIGLRMAPRPGGPNASPILRTFPAPGPPRAPCAAGSHLGGPR
jgi:hypothetical protein